MSRHRRSRPRRPDRRQFTRYLSWHHFSLAFQRMTLSCRFLSLLIRGAFALLVIAIIASVCFFYSCTFLPGQDNSTKETDGQTSEVTTGWSPTGEQLRRCVRRVESGGVTPLYATAFAAGPDSEVFARAYNLHLQGTPQYNLRKLSDLGMFSWGGAYTPTPEHFIQPCAAVPLWGGQ